MRHIAATSYATLCRDVICDSRRVGHCAVVQPPNVYPEEKDVITSTPRGPVRRQIFLPESFAKTNSWDKRCVLSLTRMCGKLRHVHMWLPVTSGGANDYHRNFPLQNWQKWYVMWCVNCNWVDTWWQQYSTHLHTNSTQNDTMKQNTQNGTYITIRIHKYTNKNT